ncbi:hypothetical protein ACNKHM_23245 [Shigella sonnei]
MGLISFLYPPMPGYAGGNKAGKVIMGFPARRCRFINSLIDKKTGLYVLSHRGAWMDVENLKQIHFQATCSQYFPWPSAGNMFREMTN